MNKIAQAVIMAGGKGTRVSSIARDIPKPMLRICEKPILEHQIEVLKKNGISEIIIVTGFLHEKIEEYFENGKKFNCNISYYTERDPLGSGGALFKLKDRIQKTFLLINGDVIFDVNIEKFFEFHKRNNALASLASHPNSHPFDSSLLITDANNKITGWISKEDDRLYYKNLVNAGLHLLSKDLFSEIEIKKEIVNLDKDILKPLLKTGRVYAYKTPEYIKDMGTLERFDSVSKDAAENKPAIRNLANKQRAVFLDRDGTLNKDNGFITKPEQFELTESAAEAVKLINESAYLAIVITNQPVIARGECSFSELELIHNKMETELGKTGAFLDDIYFCPHHPDNGFSGEIPEYKVECNCRKPKPGMFFSAAKKYNIELSESFMIGDTENDEKAGKAAGCKTIILKEMNLIEAVKKCLRQ